jgi:PAS domain S-box-containing protein
VNRDTRTILIIDDSPEDRELYRRYLLQDGDYSYKILEASLGELGLELWQQNQPDTILLDYRLPDCDGLEFLAEMSKQTQQQCLPVIMVTGEGNEQVAVQVMKAGAQDYLVKEQITPEGLQLAVNRAIKTVRLNTQLQQHVERERLVSQMTRKIHQSLDLEEILQTTVTEVRQFLRSDRVLIFRLLPDGWGIVTNESVSSQWTSLLSTSLYDPCFNDSYLESFTQGLITAKKDIYDGSISPCHVELLENLQVRANLVVPILQDKQLWGMLIVHHCAAPRQWQPLEIDLLKELAAQVGIALQQAELYQQAQTELAERSRTEAELRKSEERFRQLAENIDAVFWVTELPERRVSYISPAYERLWGLNPQNLYDSQQTWVNLLHPEDREETERTFQQKAAEGGSFDQEYRIVLPDGRVRWVRDRCFPLQDESGRIYRLTGIAEDITDSKQAELALEASQAQLQQQLAQIEAIYQSAPIGLNVLDTELRFVRINERLAEMNGLPVEAHIGRSIRELLPELADTAEQVLRPILETGEPLLNVELEGETPAKPGVKRTWLEHFLPLKNGDQVIGISTVCAEITERKQTEQALRESEARLKLAYKATKSGLYDWDMIGGSAYVSEEYCALFGLDPSTQNVSAEQWLAFLHPDDRTPAIEEITQTVQQREDYYEDEYRILHPDGIRWLASKGQIFYDDLGNAVRMIGNVQDITDRKEAEIERDHLLEQEQLARSQAEHANRIKDEFLAILSHELRSPLNPILGWTRLLQTRKLDESRTKEALATIERNVKLQAQLIDDLLDVARILRGKLSLNAAPTSLVAVIESAIETVKTAAIAKSILIHQVLPDIGQVLGDPMRLQQIVWNLLSNAIKFTPMDGRVSIYLKRIDGHAQIKVTDTGKGINPDFLPHIFEYFRQEDSSITRQYGGLGLGLAIVRSLVEAHGGTICANSPGVGQGATFTIRLPLLSDQVQKDDSKGLKDGEVDLTGTRVLLVDDEADNRELLAFIIKEYGAQVMGVASAGEVFAIIESFKPHILVSDIGMPESDGYTLVKQVRSLQSVQGGVIPAIAITAYAREEDRQLALSAGFQEHISKPVEPKKLVEAIANLLNYH